jgi:dephospho-CoA kinase
MRKNKVNIAIIGGLGSGKTTLANILAKELGYNQYAFAKEVKHIGQIINPNLDSSDNDKATKRKFWQDIGELLKKRRVNLTDVDLDIINGWLDQSRLFDIYYNRNFQTVHTPTFYYEKLFEDRDFTRDFNNGNAVVHDMRFINEGNLWRNEKSGHYNIVIKCAVPEEIRIQRILARDNTFNPEWLKNSSESEWFKINYDYVIDNTKSIEEVTEELLEIVKYLA